MSRIMHLSEDHTGNSLSSQKAPHAVARAWVLMAIPAASRASDLSLNLTGKLLPCRTLLKPAEDLPQNVSFTQLSNVWFCLEIQF